MGPVLNGFHLKIVGLRKAAKAIIHYKNSGFSVFIVFKMDIASSPLEGFVWSPEWPPFGPPKPKNISKGRPRAVLGRPKRAAEAIQEGPKNGSEKKSAKNRVDVGIGAADTFRHHWFWCPGRR